MDNDGLADAVNALEQEGLLDSDSSEGYEIRPKAMPATSALYFDLLFRNSIAVHEMVESLWDVLRMK